MRKLILLSLIVTLSSLWSAANCPLQVRGGDAVSVSVYIATVDSGKPVVDYGSQRLMTPASIMKTLTVASATRLLGPDFRWTTEVQTIGKIENGTLHGNLIIKGGGDPTLSSRYFKEQPSFISAVASALRKANIETINGRILTDETAVPDGGAVSTWEVEDIPWDYGAGAFAINYADNSFALTVPTMQTSLSVPGLEITNRLTSKGSQLTLRRGVDSDRLTVGGSLGKRKQATLNCSMPHPASVLVAKVEDSLAKLGIRVKKEKVATDGKPHTILEYKSPRFAEVGRSLMVRSDNLMAEATLRALAPGAPIDSALSRERKLWHNSGIDLSLWRINDGSGLSRANAISARKLGEVLRYMALDRKVSADYIDTFARVGLDGTLTSFLAKNPRKQEFVLKSGSMGGVQCYAGYRIDPETRGATHVIVVMVNNLSGSRTDLRKSIENMILEAI